MFCLVLRTVGVLLDFWLPCISFHSFVSASPHNLLGIFERSIETGLNVSPQVWPSVLQVNCCTFKDKNWCIAAKLHGNKMINNREHVSATENALTTSQITKKVLSLSQLILPKADCHHLLPPHITIPHCAGAVKSVLVSVHYVLWHVPSCTRRIMIQTVKKVKVLHNIKLWRQWDNGLNGLRNNVLFFWKIIAKWLFMKFAECTMEHHHREHLGLPQKQS